MAVKAKRTTKKQRNLKHIGYEQHVKLQRRMKHKNKETKQADKSE